MSDGPHRSLNMRPGWKKVAEFADNAACTKDEIGSVVGSAIGADWRCDVSDDLAASLREILGERQDSLFRDQKVGQLEALRHATAGHELGQLLIDCAVQHVVNAGPSPDAALEATADALAIWSTRHGRQIEEHYRRESSDQRARSVRSRIEEQIGSPSFQDLARELLRPGGAPMPRTPPKKTGIDDGVEL